MAGKLLTVIVPSYNMEAYLPACLASLEGSAQQMAQLDVLVVNDGSRDHTSEIAHAFAARHSNAVRVIDKPNGNYGSCINAALALAQGSFVKVLDADDTFAPAAFAAFLEFLNTLADPLPDLVLSDYEIVDAEGRTTHREILPFAKERPFDLGVFLAGPDVVNMHALTYRTQLLRDLGYRQMEGLSYTDREWTLLPLVDVRKVVYAPHIVYRYLSGRAGQTMDPICYARAWGMRGEVAASLAVKFASTVDRVPEQWRGALERRVALDVAEVYRGALFDDPKGAAAYDLTALEADLAEHAPHLHAALAAVPYSNRVSYRFIQAWRTRSPIWPQMKLFCKAYSKLVHFVLSARTILKKR